jgi:hypothetical protein
MSINYCTIGLTTVNSFCNAERTKVLARLIQQAGHDVVPTPQPTNGGSGGSAYSPGIGIQPGVRPMPPPRWTPPEIDHIEAPREQPFITVYAEIMGMMGSETLEVTQRLDFVTITDLEVNHNASITVNISEMEMGPVNSITINISEMEFGHA